MEKRDNYVVRLNGIYKNNLNNSKENDIKKYIDEKNAWHRGVIKEVVVLDGVHHKSGGGF